VCVCVCVFTVCDLLSMWVWPHRTGKGSLNIPAAPYCFFTRHYNEVLYNVSNPLDDENLNEF
jgi:hypothetical protein